jgi:hypothetical protein
MKTGKSDKRYGYGADFADFFIADFRTVFGSISRNRR